MPGSPEVPTLEGISPEDIIEEEADKTKAIPIEKEYPPWKEDYLDEEAIRRGEVAKPLGVERFTDLTQAVRDEIGTNVKYFFGRDPAIQEFQYIGEYEGKTLEEVKNSEDPELAAEAVFSEFAAEFEGAKDYFLSGESPLGELAPEEKLAVETLLGFPTSIADQYKLERLEEEIEAYREKFFPGARLQDIQREQENISDMKDKRGLSSRFLDREEHIKHYANLDQRRYGLITRLAEWQQKLYKFVISNQNHLDLRESMERFFSTFQNLGFHENFRNLGCEKFLPSIASLRAGALAPITAAKVFEELGSSGLGISLFLPKNIKSDVAFSTDLIARFGHKEYLIVQVKHNGGFQGVDIDGEMSYNYEPERQALHRATQRYVRVLGEGSRVVPRMVIVGNVGEDARFNGIPSGEVPVSGKKTPQEILEGGVRWEM